MPTMPGRCGACSARNSSCLGAPRPTHRTRAPDSADPGPHGLDLLRAEGAERRRLPSGDGEARHAAAHLGREPLRHALAAAEEVMGPAGRDAAAAQGLDRFDAGHVAGRGEAEQAPDPEDGPAVRHGQPGIAVGLTHAGARLRFDDAVRAAEGHERAGGLGPASQAAVDGVEEAGHVDRGDRHAPDLEDVHHRIMRHGKTSSEREATASA